MGDCEGGGVLVRIERLEEGGEASGLGIGAAGGVELSRKPYDMTGQCRVCAGRRLGGEARVEKYREEAFAKREGMGAGGNLLDQ